MGLGVRELFDNNIKVHFAGSDGGEIFYAALLAAQTKYRLFSCYKYILKCRPDDDFRLPADHVIRVQDTVNRHVIQDSGLFTLMFGAGKGQDTDVGKPDRVAGQAHSIRAAEQSPLYLCRAGLPESAGRKGSVVLPGADEEAAG